MTKTSRQKHHLSTVVSFFSLIALLLSLYSCSKTSQITEMESMGPSPILPEPSYSLIPTVKIAPAKGWAANAAPKAHNNLLVKAYARDLNHPRMLHVLPNGDVLVAETNAPKKPDQGGIKSWIMKLVMKKVGAAVPSADRITLLRGLDINGSTQFRSVFIEGLHSPFGMALVGDYFYVANTDAVLRFPYKVGDTTISSPGVKIADLPAGNINYHWTKDLIASPNGKYLYVTVGSNSNIGENGMDKEVGRAAIHQIELATGESRVYATGLRNANGLAWQSETGELWAAINERDELGNDLVPDYMTSIKEGGFYGWPYSYFGQHVDTRVKPQRPDLVKNAIMPDYALGAHTGSLGLTFYNGKLFPEKYWGGAFVGQHGSWNRKPLSGYKVIFIPFEKGTPVGKPQDILTGFVDAEGYAQGRPVGVAIDSMGALLVADDVGNIIWRVTAP